MRPVDSAIPEVRAAELRKRVQPRAQSQRPLPDSGELTGFVTGADCAAVKHAPEPRLLSFNAYANLDASEVTCVQVHPDAESMVHHLSVIKEHAVRAYVDFLERESRFQIYGIPTAGVLDLIQQLAGSAEALTSQEPFAGFIRLGSTAAASR